jgi:hypothetical protein
MGPERHDASGYLYMALGFSMIGLVIGLAMVTRMIGPASIPIWGAALIALMVLGNGPVGKAIARRIGGEPAAPAGTLEVPEELYAELDELRARMLEMEERQDFAERLLSVRPDAERLSPGGET